MASCPPGYPVPRSRWRERGESCLLCEKRFTLFTAKANCHCCGQLFCTDCFSPEKCVLVSSAPPSPVCVKCFAMIQELRAADTASLTAEAAEELVAASKILREENEEAVLALNEKERIVTTLRGELLGLQQKMQAQEVALAEMRTHLSVAQASLEAAQRKQNSAAVDETSASEIQSKCDEYAVTIADYEGKLREAAERCLSVSIELETARDSWSGEANALKDELARERKEKESAVASLRDEADMYLKREDEWRHAREDLHQQVSFYQDQLTVAKSAMSKSEEQLATATSASAGAQQGIVSLRREYEVKEAQLTQKIEESEKDSARVVSQLEEKEKAVDALLWENSELKETVDNYARQVQLLQVKCAELETEKGDRINTKRELDTAGPQLDASRPTGNGRWQKISVVQPINYSLRPITADPLPGGDLYFQWSYDTMGAAEQVPSVLQSAARAVAMRWGVFDNSAEEMSCWLTMSAVVENNYYFHPYHNAVHAADVLQSVSAILESTPMLLNQLTRIEKLAAMFAPIIHDVRHPGRNTPFLRKTLDPQYLMCCCSGALEYMHVGTAFAILAIAEADFTASMNDSQAMEFFDLVSYIVLNTDMTKHKDLVERCQTKALGDGYDFANAEDRKELLAFIVHTADISAQSKGVDVAKKWLVILEEMYQQGDEEKQCGIPIMPGNARGGQWEKGQLFFLCTFVIPTFHVLSHISPGLASPLQNLRALHEYYIDLCGGGPPFPQAAPPTSARALDIAPPSSEAASSDLAEREAKLAQRELQLDALEEEMRRQLHEAQLAVSANSTPLKHISESALEQRLRHTVGLLVHKGKDLRHRIDEFNRCKAELEGREQRASELADQLTAIARRVARQREMLRLRETQLRRSPQSQMHPHTASSREEKMRVTVSAGMVPSDLLQQLERSAQLLTTAMARAPSHRHL